MDIQSIKYRMKNLKKNKMKYWYYGIAVIIAIVIILIAKTCNNKKEESATVVSDLVNKVNKNIDSIKDDVSKRVVIIDSLRAQNNKKVSSIKKYIYQYKQSKDDPGCPPSAFNSMFNDTVVMIKNCDSIIGSFEVVISNNNKIDSMHIVNEGALEYSIEKLNDALQSSQEEYLILYNENNKLKKKNKRLRILFLGSASAAALGYIGIIIK